MEASTFVRVVGELSESFPVGDGIREGCVMSPWWLNIFMDGCMREMKANVGNVGAKLKINGMGCTVVACLFAESEDNLQRMVDELYSVCMRKKS